MDRPDWNEIDALLDEALDLPPDERAGFLDRRCPDAALRSRLERLIAAAETEAGTLRAGGALAGPLGDEVSRQIGRDDTAPDEIPGYRLLREIGSGGMGHVWEAEQLEPVHRRVAVKIIRPGMDSGRVVARFEAERQTLALMSHPGIAQIFDAGVTASGRPFFAMEYVDGSPIISFCDESRLSVRGRLNLFVEVCEAVQHAHQKGVIHRDLKPLNVLVTRIDGRPVPKIIDFGIARVVDEVRGAGALLTEAGQVIGTPEYMSPEQTGERPEDVDTRTDVYALGVLLYELLAGTLPFRRRDVSPAALVDLFREVRETEPLPPSRRVAAPGDGSRSVAGARASDPSSLARRLRGDLDWIVAKALEKERARRYESPGDLAADIRRHLKDEPVVAGPPGAVYRLVKFARRNSGLIAATAAVLVALVAGLVGTATGLVKAREEAGHARTQAAIAQAVNAFLNEDLLAAVAPGSQGRDVTMREVLDTAAGRLEGRFPDQPEVEATLRRTIGDTYLRLGRLDDASPQLERALSLFEAALGRTHPDTLEAVHALGELRFYQGRASEAEELMRRCFEGREQELGPTDPGTLSALSDLGAVAQDLGRLDEAESHYREAFMRASATLGEDDVLTLSMLHNLGALTYDRGRFEDAEGFLRRALEGSRRVLGPEHPETLNTLSLLGSVLRKADRLEEAEPIYVEVLETRRRVLGNEHPSTLLSANNLAILWSDLGRLEEAAALQEETLQAQRRLLGEDHDATILSMGNFGSLLTRLGRAREAESLLAEAVERCQRTLGAGHALCGNTMRKYGECLAALGRHGEAERAVRESRGILSAALGADHPDTLRAGEVLDALRQHR